MRAQTQHELTQHDRRLRREFFVRVTLCNHTQCITQHITIQRRVYEPKHRLHGRLGPSRTNSREHIGQSLQLAYDRLHEHGRIAGEHGHSITVRIAHRHIVAGAPRQTQAFNLLLKSETHFFGTAAGTKQLQHGKRDTARVRVRIAWHGIMLADQSQRRAQHIQSAEIALGHLDTKCVAVRTLQRAL